MNAVEQSYPWYLVVQGEQLSQGDIIPGCPAFSLVEPDDLSVLKDANALLDTDVLELDMVVLTQACDLEHDKIDTVVLCPVWPVEALAQRDEAYRPRKAWDRIRKGEVPAYHMLNENPSTRFALSVVDFHRLYTLPKRFLATVAAARGQRLRLLPPYREHLAQAFARYFMRVGLPIDIPSLR